MKAEADIAIKMQSPELSEAEKIQFEAQKQMQLEEMRQEHDVEMALLNARLQAETGKAADAATIERDADGRPVSVNGRAVMRDESGAIIGLQ
jgi:phosphopantetheinyl transferase